MEKIFSVVGAVIVVSVIGAFTVFERPEIIDAPGAVTTMCNFKNKE